eukprot:scaffold32050_cov38-Cyclotella_meneghiniana.AAC.1
MVLVDSIVDQGHPYLGHFLVDLLGATCPAHRSGQIDPIDRNDLTLGNVLLAYHGWSCRGFSRHG